jgi:GTP-binding protein SAR1
MVDAADPTRLEEAKNELDGLLGMQELKGVPVVVFGNKVDRKEALQEEQLREMLQLPFHMTSGKDPKQ